LNQSIFLKVLASTLLLFADIISLAHAQQSASQKNEKTAIAIPLPNVYLGEVGEEDLDLLNPPLLSKYAHGLKRVDGNGIRSRMASPPTQKQARELYGQSQDLRDVGFAYLMYKHPEKAIVRLKQALTLWPDSATTYRWLAEAYAATGQTKEAVANYRLLFYGWPGKSVSDTSASDTVDTTKPKETPSDKPSDYDQPNPEETDPTLLMQFALLLEQTHQYLEARSIYERGMMALSEKSAAKGEPLPPLFASSFTSPTSLEAATRTALAIDQSSYQDKKEAEENLKQALLLQPDFITALYYKAKLVNNQQ
jgi:tetratricopeptide (TPR) repeat protein